MNLSQDNVPIKELMSLTAKCAVVTGGAKGIGLSISVRLAEAGARVLIVDMDADAAEEASNEIIEHGYQASFTRCDVSNEDEVKRMIDIVVKQMGGVDILVNNAGIYPRKPLVEMTGKDFERVLSVNLFGTFLCSRYACKEMIRRRRDGCIINIASIEAVHPSSTGMSAYDASKGGVLMLTKSMARELGPHGIRVNAIAPGAILTREVLQNTGTYSQDGARAQLKELKAFMSRMALGRMGKADDIARVALFLASELASYITGDLIVVDGGYLVS
ncbi:SDR family NAD(P)-dependent oxidoreductase [Chloroflexota bacterium]